MKQWSEKFYHLYFQAVQISISNWFEVDINEKHRKAYRDYLESMESIKRKKRIMQYSDWRAVSSADRSLFFLLCKIHETWYHLKEGVNLWNYEF